jgi:hypothetical protein
MRPLTLLFTLGCCWLLLVSADASAQAVSTQSSSEKTRSSEGESYLSPGRTLAFADHLYNQGDFGRAISEYQRYLFTASVGEMYHAHYRVGASLMQLDEYGQAPSHFLQAARHTEHAALRDSAYVGYLGGLLAGERTARLFNTADTLNFSSPSSQRRLYQIRSLAHLRQSAWSAAEQSLKRIPPPAAEKGNPFTARISELVTRGQHLPRKSSWLAGTMSALVPGTGKMYAGRTSDGLYSLALIGGASWLAYRGFRDDGTSSVKGWLLGSVGAVLYVGNIYGSVVAVRLYNANHEEALQRDIEAQITITTRF